MTMLCLIAENETESDAALRRARVRPAPWCGYDDDEDEDFFDPDDDDDSEDTFDEFDDFDETVGDDEDETADDEDL